MSNFIEIVREMWMCIKSTHAQTLREMPSDVFCFIEIAYTEHTLVNRHNITFLTNVLWKEVVHFPWKACFEHNIFRVVSLSRIQFPFILALCLTILSFINFSIESWKVTFQGHFPLDPWNNQVIKYKLSYSPIIGDKNCFYFRILWWEV